MRFKRRLSSISVGLEDRVVYLAGSDDIEGTTVNDTIYYSSGPLLARGSLLRGSIRIKLTSQCSFRQLHVVLLGTLQTLAIGKAGPNDHGLPAQKHENLRHEVNILEGRSPHFEAGVHELPFAVLLPPDLQPSFRCPYGRQEYTVCALAEEVDGKVHASKPECVNLLSPGDTANTSAPFVDVVTHNPSLGYITATMHSDIPSVGAQAFLQLDIPSPMSDVTVASIRVSLLQSMQIKPATGANVVRTSEQQLARFYNAKSVITEQANGSKKAAIVPRWTAGEPVSVSQFVMLPTHQTFAPSTSLPKSCDVSRPNLKMAVSHHAVVKIRFHRPELVTMKEVTVTSRNVFLVSCKCLPNSLVLPPYTPTDLDAIDGSNESLTRLTLSRRRAQPPPGLDDCTCFNTKLSLQQSVSSGTVRSEENTSAKA